MYNPIHTDYMQLTTNELQARVDKFIKMVTYYQRTGNTSLYFQGQSVLSELQTELSRRRSDELKKYEEKNSPEQKEEKDKRMSLNRKGT